MLRFLLGVRLAKSHPSLMVACGWNASVPIGPRAVVFSDNKFWTYAKTARGRCRIYGTTLLPYLYYTRGLG